MILKTTIIKDEMSGIIFPLCKECGASHRMCIENMETGHIEPIDICYDCLWFGHILPVNYQITLRDHEENDSI